VFVILTSKAGQFHSEPGPGLEPLETWDYRFGGRDKATFVIARVRQPCTVRIVDSGQPPVVNRIASKFLPGFDTLEQARAELRSLTRSNALDVELRRQEAT
jgi:hypothetical protein